MDFRRFRLKNTLSIGRKSKTILYTDKLKEKVKDAIEKASKAAYKASKKIYDEFPVKYANGEPVDLKGDAFVRTKNTSSVINLILKDNNLAKLEDKHYTVYAIEKFPSKSITVNKAGANAAAAYLTKQLEQKFYVYREYESTPTKRSK